FKTSLWITDIVLDYVIISKDFSFKMKKLTNAIKSRGAKFLHGQKSLYIFLSIHDQIDHDLNAKGNKKRRLSDFAQSFLEDHLEMSELPNFDIPKTLITIEDLIEQSLPAQNVLEGVPDNWWETENNDPTPVLAPTANDNSGIAKNINYDEITNTWGYIDKKTGEYIIIDPIGYLTDRNL